MLNENANGRVGSGKLFVTNGLLSSKYCILHVNVSLIITNYLINCMYVKFYLNDSNKQQKKTM